MTGALLQAQYGMRSQGSVAASRSVGRVIDGMESVLTPFLQPGIDNVQRRRNLEMISSRAAKLGFLLFSQPGRFRIEFSGSRKGAVIVFPSLVQTHEDEGSTISPPRVLSDLEVSA